MECLGVRCCCFESDLDEVIDRKDLELGNNFLEDLLLLGGVFGESDAASSLSGGAGGNC